MKVLLGLGSNQGQSRAVFRDCLDRLARDGDILATSRIWRTRAIGPPQPDYLNMAAIIEWPRDPRHLLERCRQLEAVAGRNRTREERWGPRRLDLDLLLAEGLVFRSPTLEIPHPRFHQRRFALEPAAEIAPGWTHPFVGLTVEALTERARQQEPDAILGVMSFEF